MLIRLVSHHVDNPNHVDKLINIDGLPEAMFFIAKDDKKYIKQPWDFDITANLPLDIRMKFQPTPMKIWTQTPSEQRPGQVDPNMPKWIVDEHEVYGLRLDYQSGPGKDMWDQVADLLERETPRHLKVPRPKAVGTRMIWELTADQVPSVSLVGETPKIEPEELKPIRQEIARPDQFQCQECGEVYEKQRGLWMHRRRKHKVSEPMKVG